MKSIKNLFISFLFIPFISSCVGSPIAYYHTIGEFDVIRNRNRTNISKLELAMTKSEVLKIMGIEPNHVWIGVGSKDFTINNPFKTEIFNSNQGPLEVIYYYTDLVPHPGMGIPDDELTPIVLKENKVIGWGRSFFDQSVQKMEVRIR